jgi:hypothetical protein
MTILSKRRPTARVVDAVTAIVEEAWGNPGRRKTAKAVAVAAAGVAGLTAASARISILRRGGAPREIS